MMTPNLPAKGMVRKLTFLVSYVIYSSDSDRVRLCISRMTSRPSDSPSKLNCKYSRKSDEFHPAVFMITASVAPRFSRPIASPIRKQCVEYSDASSTFSYGGIALGILSRSEPCMLGITQARGVSGSISGRTSRTGQSPFDAQCF